MTLIPSEQLARVFVEIADTMVDDFDLVEFLEMVVTRATDVLSATGAGLLLSDDEAGRLQLAAATDGMTKQVELFQVQVAEGPCHDAFHQGAPVTCPDLASAGGRWPRFAPFAVEAGFGSVHAFPLRLRREVIGALNVFNDRTGCLDPAATSVVQAFADVAAIGLIQERAIRRAAVLTQQLQSALESRIVIEQAKGALAQIHACTVDEAFTMLRSWCRRNRQGLSEVALGITSDPARFPELTRAPWPPAPPA